MTPAHYTREHQAKRYAADLARAWPPSLHMSFQAVPHGDGFSVQATDERGRTYLVTARVDRLGAVNFIAQPFTPDEQGTIPGPLDVVREVGKRGLGGAS